MRWIDFGVAPGSIVLGVSSAATRFWCLHAGRNPTSRRGETASEMGHPDGQVRRRRGLQGQSADQQSDAGSILGHGGDADLSAFVDVEFLAVHDSLAGVADGFGVYLEGFLRAGAVLHGELVGVFIDPEKGSYGLFERGVAKILDCDCGADAVLPEEEDDDLVVGLVEGAGRDGKSAHTLLEVERGFGLHDLEEAGGTIIRADLDRMGRGVDCRDRAAEGVDNFLSGRCQGGKS
jgi:hypothetical protein